MSTRAYRIIKIERAPEPTFNMSHDQKIVDFIRSNDEYFNENSLNEGNGQVDVSVDTLKALLKSGIVLEDSQLEAIRADILFAEKNGDDCITYDCF